MNKEVSKMLILVKEFVGLNEWNKLIMALVMLMSRMKDYGVSDVDVTL